jgi:signal transduction histidine kinase
VAFNRLALLQAGLVSIILLGGGFWIRSHFRSQYWSNAQDSVTQFVTAMSNQLPEKVGEDWCFDQIRGTHIRLTVIHPISGLALCDSQYETKYGSLLNRPEIASAISSDGEIATIRPSEVLKSEAMYMAKFVKEKGLIVRAGLSLAELDRSIKTLDQALILGILGICVVIYASIFWTARGALFRTSRRAVKNRTDEIFESFLANVSHELRTPLTTIKGFAEVLRNDHAAGRPLDPEFLTIISNDSSRMLGLVEELLDLSSLEAGSLQLTPEPIDVDPITQEVITRLQLIYAAKKQELLSSSSVKSVFADPDRLTQVLLNLVGNAMKYCPNGARIHILWESSATGVRLVVSDNGPGISEKDRKLIFRKFYRVHKGLNEASGKGAGLGLGIVKQIVELHGGRIICEENVGGGTRFVVEWPPTRDS